MSGSSEFIDALVEDLNHQKATVERLSRELEHVRDVLEWANKNAASVIHNDDDTSTVYCNLKHFDGPSLSEALEQAWLHRYDKPVLDAATELSHLYPQGQRPVNFGGVW